MPRQTEPNANNALGILLQGMMHGATVRSENVRSIVGNPSLQPDIVITEDGRAPIIIEAEFEPAQARTCRRLDSHIASLRPMNPVKAVGGPQAV